MTKNFVVQTEAFLPYMRDVTACEQSLQELGLMWRLIEASAKMNCPNEAKTILSTMAATRAGFTRLEQELVSTLVQEKVANVSKAIGTKAQYIIDIIVRNLFERTADVGFLATDRELCSYVAGMQTDRAAIEERLRQYRSKYTVYDEILLLDTSGTVLAQVDAAAPLQRSADPLLAVTLASDTYVETFRATDLRAQKDRALIYSRRMHHPESGAVVGVLCLCFQFEEEMAGIFQSHRDPDNQAIMLLLDGSNHVIASGEAQWVATGTVVPANPAGEMTLMPFCGRQYLVRTIGSAGYQGYPGPAGWQGQVMIPAEIAFSNSGTDLLKNLDPSLADGLLSHADTFCPPLHDIMKAASAGASTIDRIVWNGQLLTAGQHGEMQKLKSILDQISETGSRSNHLFAQSIRALYQTVLVSDLRDAEFTSRLLVDLLDRNLYERSDDCRWWALTPELRTVLSMPVRDSAALEKTNAVLGYINGLYTVYTRIFLYDRDGIIIAATGQAQDSDIVGSRIDDACLAGVRRLASDQDYHVSQFAATALYSGGSTYVYHAALRALDDSPTVIGGIGIVFDSTPEFFNMLQAGLGKRDNMTAFYLDRSGRILSSSDTGRTIGAQLPIDADLLLLANGESKSRMTIYEDQYAIVACTASSGYRDFKNSDGYKEDVVAVVFQTFGMVQKDCSAPRHGRVVLEPETDTDDASEFATFFSGPNLLAISATSVRQAVPYAAVLPTAVGGRFGRIGLLDLKGGDRHRDFVWVFDLGQALGGQASPIGANSQVMILEYGAHTIGLLVDDLHAVPQFSPGHMIPMPKTAPGNCALVTHLIRANKGALLIQVIDVDHLFARLLQDDVPVPVDSATRMLAAA